MKTLLSFALLAVVVASASHASIKTEEVTYSEGGKTFKGFLAWDDAISGKGPGVLVVHEWWGLNDYARGRAKQLAELGYTALAVDMFGDGKVADHPKDAGAFAGSVMKDPQVALARFTAAMEFLKSQPTVDPDKIAAIGYCMGGAIVLNAARQGLDLDAVASFHGSLGGLMPIKGPIKAKILVCHGADDSFIPPETVEAFKREMKERGSRLQIHLLSRGETWVHQPRSGRDWEEVRAQYCLQCRSRHRVVEGIESPAPRGLSTRRIELI